MGAGCSVRSGSLLCVNRIFSFFQLQDSENSVLSDIPSDRCNDIDLTNKLYQSWKAIQLSFQENSNLILKHLFHVI